MIIMKSALFSITTCLLLVLAIVGCSRQRPSVQPAFQDFTLLASSPVLSDFTNKRASSWDQTGGNSDWVKIAPGKTHTLLQENGAGCIKHFYWAYIKQDRHGLKSLFRGVVLRCFWDGSDTPAIEVPLGDFFGVTNGQIRDVKSLAFVTNPGFHGTDDSWGFNCYLPMPFANGARIELVNQSGDPTRLWFHIDYQLYDDPSVLGENVGRLHAKWNRENPTTAVLPKAHAIKGRNLTGDQNYTILETDADGQFVGYFLTVVNFKPRWWGEGDDMVFIDGQPWPPQIHGTGSEEIFGGGACPAKEFSGPYTGFHCIENKNQRNFWGTNGMYRFYLTDPLRFKKSIRATIEHGEANNLANDYTSVAFWYQKGTNKNLSPLPAFSQRRLTDVITPPQTETLNGVFVEQTEVAFTVPEKNVEIRYTLDGSDPTPDSLKYTKPLKLTNTTTIKARTFRKANASDVTICTRTKTQYLQHLKPVDVTGLVNGLRYEYYPGAWGQLPDFSSLKSAAAGIIENFDITKSPADDNFAYNFTGYIRIPADGVYTFGLLSDDSSRLYIGDTLVVDHDGVHAAIYKYGQVALRAGLHPIIVLYFEKNRRQQLNVYYAGPGIEKQLIPNNALFTDR